MTEEQYNAALEVVRLFLVCRGWDERHIDDNLQNGHWLLRLIADAKRQTCPNCRDAFLKNLLLRMEDGSYILGEPTIVAPEGFKWLEFFSHSWKETFTAEVRLAAGYNS